ncbi:MAG: flagellar basal body P-ring protein FlgI [Pseudomonadota bacterium]
MRNAESLLLSHARRRLALLLTVVLVCLIAPLGELRAERIKDIASIQGVRTNQLVGYGLVVGLDGTGDQTVQARFTQQSIINMLQGFGITIPPNTNLQLTNVASVIVHADLPPFGKPGQQIDVTVSSLGNADSLRGGSLIMTPLKGADGGVYAIAQGNLIASGFGASGNTGTSVNVGVKTVARIPNGATIERTVPSAFGNGDSIRLNLHTPDFTTVRRVTDSINAFFGPEMAMAVDQSTLAVRAPEEASQRVAFVAELENLEVEPGEAPARVIVNSRTGTVVIGSHVRVYPAAVTHGTLTVTISEQPGVSQPSPFGGGATAVVEQSAVEITEQENAMFLFEPGVTLSDIVTAVNQVGAGPSDLVSILQALKHAGALRAELVVI